jgi:hypothetical protein
VFDCCEVSQQELLHTYVVLYTYESRVFSYQHYARRLSDIILNNLRIFPQLSTSRVGSDISLGDNKRLSNHLQTPSKE